MIRSIAPADIPLILPLVRQVPALHVADMPARYWPQQDADALTAFYQDRLDQGQTILIDDRDGVAAGFALFLVKNLPENLFRRAETLGHLDQICVDKAFRRQGVGKALINEMIGRLRAKDIARWSADYWVFNTASAALMASCGATPAFHHAEGPVDP